MCLISGLPGWVQELRPSVAYLSGDQRKTVREALDVRGVLNPDFKFLFAGFCGCVQLAGAQDCNEDFL